MLHHTALGTDRRRVRERDLVALDRHDRADELIAAAEAHRRGLGPNVHVEKFDIDTAAERLPVAGHAYRLLAPGQSQVVTPAESGRVRPGEVEHVDGPGALAAIVAAGPDLLVEIGFARLVARLAPDAAITDMGVACGYGCLLADLEIADFVEYDDVRTGDRHPGGLVFGATGAEIAHIQPRFRTLDFARTHIVEIRIAAARHGNGQHHLGNARGHGVHPSECTPWPVAPGGEPARGKRAVGFEPACGVVFIDSQLYRPAAIAKRNFVPEPPAHPRARLHQMAGALGSGDDAQKAFAVRRVALDHIQLARECRGQPPLRRRAKVALEHPSADGVALGRCLELDDGLEARVLKKPFPCSIRRGERHAQAGEQQQGCSKRSAGVSRQRSCSPRVFICGFQIGADTTRGLPWCTHGDLHLCAASKARTARNRIPNNSTSRPNRRGIPGLPFMENPRLRIVSRTRHALPKMPTSSVS